MTKNQIDYQKLEEERYHNRVTEQEQKRTNMANEAIKSETNAINSAHYMYSDTENARHNRATEIENQRHNEQSEAISWFSAGSQDRLNQSNIALNSVISDNYLAQTDLTKQKTKTEKWNTEYTKSKNYETQQNTDLLFERTWNAKTEGQILDLERLGTTLSNEKLKQDIKWYNFDKGFEIAKWAGNMLKPLGSSISGGIQVLQSSPTYGLGRWLRNAYKEAQ